MEKERTQNIEKYFYELVNIHSDTGTEGEKEVEDYLYNELSKLKYFQNNKDKLGKYKIKSDDIGRSVVWGLLKGKGKDTIIYMHHHDVVDTTDYGKLSNKAYYPKELIEKLKEKNLDRNSMEDLKSDDWIFGRGTADMKAGGAIQFSLFKEYCNNDNFEGNIVFLSVPDEEDLSLGMREAVGLLEDLKKKYNLNYKLLINSEPHDRKKDDIGSLYEGSVGKMTPIIYVRGKQTHAADIFEGFNPISILSEIVRKIEVNVEFSDCFEGEISPPPSWINMRDRKNTNNVSIPHAASGYFNVMSFETKPREVIDIIVDKCKEGFQDYMKIININYSKYKDKDISHIKYKPRVKTFKEIFEEAKRNNGEEFIKEFNSDIEKLRGKIIEGKTTLREGSLIIIENILDYLDDKSPIVVVGIAPPFYPAMKNLDVENLNDKIKNLSNKINQFTKKRWNQEYKKYNYFMGISDMSYTYVNDLESICDTVSLNMPLWDNIYHINFEGIKNLSIPSINIGPWGKDLHKMTERVYKEDLYNRTPEIIAYVTEYILDH